MLVRLGTIRVLCFAVGMAIALGAATFTGEIAAALETRPAQWLQLVLEIGLPLPSFRSGSKKRREGGGRVMRWRERTPGTARRRRWPGPPSRRPASRSRRCSPTWP